MSRDKWALYRQNLAKIDWVFVSLLRILIEPNSDEAPFANGVPSTEMPAVEGAGTSLFISKVDIKTPGC